MHLRLSMCVMLLPCGDAEHAERGACGGDEKPVVLQFPSVIKSGIRYVEAALPT